MGIYDFIPIPEILSATCRKARDHSFEQQHTSPGGAAATSVPIADCSKQLSIYLSIMAVIVDDASSHSMSPSTCTIH